MTPLVHIQLARAGQIDKPAQKRRTGWTAEGVTDDRPCEGSLAKQSESGLALEAIIGYLESRDGGPDGASRAMRDPVSLSEPLDATWPANSGSAVSLLIVPLVCRAPECQQRR